jgi:hypothetical protein
LHVQGHAFGPDNAAFNAFRHRHGRSTRKVMEQAFPRGIDQGLAAAQHALHINGLDQQVPLGQKIICGRSGKGFAGLPGDAQRTRSFQGRERFARYDQDRAATAAVKRHHQPIQHRQSGHLQTTTLVRAKDNGWLVHE